jgi:hypothetical protein
MKSCNSLNTYEQSTILQSQTSMTPTLMCRHQYLENQFNLSTKLTMKSTNLIHHNNENESEKNDLMRKDKFFL